MSTQTAYALYEINEELLILCPHCSEIHQIPKNTGRLVPIPAFCNAALTYIVSPTLKHKSFVSAMKGYVYDLERKRMKKQNQRDSAKKDAEVS